MNWAQDAFGPNSSLVELYPKAHVIYEEVTVTDFFPADQNGWQLLQRRLRG